MNTHEQTTFNRGATSRADGARLILSLGIPVLAAAAVTALWCRGSVSAGGPSGPATDVREATGRPELALGRTELNDYDPPEPGSYSLPVVKAAADGQVLDSTGRSQSLRSMLEGRVTILSFVYLRCASPSACPYATGVLRQIHEVTRRDPSLTPNVQLITLSFDPGHDTPQRMADYGDLFRGKGGADWHFLTTRGEAELKPILQAYDQTVDRKANMNDPLGPYFHPVRVYLIDPAGRIRNIYSFGMLDPRMIVTDVRTLMMEARNVTARD